MTQCERILAWLKKGHSITTYEAFHYWKVTRLAARIADLRERGHKIEVNTVKTIGGKRYAEYYIA